MRIVMGVLLALCSLSAIANPVVTTDLRPTVHLEAAATRDVLEDTAHARLFVEKEQASASAAQQQVSAVLTAAVAKAKKEKGVSVKTGRTSTHPVYGKDNHITGWRVRGELLLESQNMTAMSQCVTTLAKTMSIDNLWFSLSNEVRRKVQEEIQGEAITAFREKADAAKRQFGYARYALAEARIVTDGKTVNYHEGVALLSRAQSASPSVPVEAGKTTVTVSVSGMIKLEK